MLKLKIRIPYKMGKPEEILKSLRKELADAEVSQYLVVDNCIEIKLMSSFGDDKTLDLRLLEIEEGE